MGRSLAKAAFGLARGFEEASGGVVRGRRGALALHKFVVYYCNV
jgi:hypothetical protein